MAGEDLAPSTVAGYIRVFLFLALALLVMNALISPALSSGYNRSVEEQVLLYPDGSGELSADGNIENFSARQTLGDAVRFTGASDSRLAGEANIS
ncbi:hypothetical protein DEQ92_21220, partial [Haloferax sp. Atlit-6N]|uniref:hypothetical protein n=1 Tax=Haloferax sp. Atlit-6N TaxID=2077205 RepID=UPI000E38CD80